MPPELPLRGRTDPCFARSSNLCGFVLCFLRVRSFKSSELCAFVVDLFFAGFQWRNSREHDQALVLGSTNKNHAEHAERAESLSAGLELRVLEQQDSREFR